MRQVLFSMDAAAAAAPVQPEASNGAVLALFALIVAVAAWMGLRSLVRGLRARRAEASIGGDFTAYALEAMVNAAKLDGRVNDAERAAIAAAMQDLAGPEFDAGRVAQAFEAARLNKAQLVAYLTARARVFSREQKTALLKALLAVFVADGRFDESEHAALVDYTEAVGFDRQGAPQLLRGLTQDFAKGNIT